MSHRSTSISSLLFAVVLLSSFVLEPVVRAGEPGHDEDIEIGRNASGQLVAIVNSPGPNELPPVETFIHGWAANEPGTKSLDADDPENDFFRLEDGAIINLVLVSIDPALKVWSPGFLVALTDPGQSFVLGGSEFDTHPTYHIDSTDSGVDPHVAVFSVTFRMRDSGMTGYSDSIPFSLSFTPIPEPATSVMLLLGSVSLVSGRRFARRQKGESA